MRDYRLPALPRVGEFFVDGSHTFRVTAVVHDAYRGVTIHAQTEKLQFT